VRLKSLSSARPDLDARLVAILEHMMQIQPANRPQSMAEVKSMLAELPGVVGQADGQVPAVLPPSQVREVPRPDLKVDDLLLVGDGTMATEWTEVAATYGRSILACMDLDEALTTLKEAIPDAVVVAVTKSEQVRHLQALCDMCRHLHVPVCIVADPSQARSHLELARQGCDLFYLTPVKIPTVLAALENLVETSRAHALQVLVVDDDPFTLDVISEALGVYGHTCHGLADPQQFWPALESVRPQFLILDLAMGHVSGLDLCLMVRSHPRWRSLPILVLTGMAEPQTVRMVYQAGADDYATKPIHADELNERMLNRVRRLHCQAQ
jgi:DNA-binding response OmpR family regulator